MAFMFLIDKLTETSQDLFTHPEQLPTEVTKALRSHAEHQPTGFFICFAIITAGLAIIIVPRALGFDVHGPTIGELRDVNDRL